MRSITWLSVMMLLLFSCNRRQKEKPIDANMNIDVKEKDSVSSKLNPSIEEEKQSRIMISSGQFASAKLIYIQGCKFDIVLNNDDTTYVGTLDKKFITPEGYSVGKKFGDLPRNIQRDLIKESGWAYYSHLPSGWNLGFCEGSSCTGNYPKKESTVKWIFKRK